VELDFIASQRKKPEPQDSTCNHRIRYTRERALRSDIPLFSHPPDLNTNIICVGPYLTTCIFHSYIHVKIYPRGLRRHKIASSTCPKTTYQIGTGIGRQRLSHNPPEAVVSRGTRSDPGRSAAGEGRSPRCRQSRFSRFLSSERITFL
jgi:hypothetical protein